MVSLFEFICPIRIKEGRVLRVLLRALTDTTNAKGCVLKLTTNAKRCVLKIIILKSYIFYQPPKPDYIILIMLVIYIYNFHIKVSMQSNIMMNS